MRYYDAILRLYFGSLNAKKKCFCRTSGNSENKIDTSLFVQKPCLTTSYIESIFDVDINMRGQFKLTNLYDPNRIREAASNMQILYLTTRGK